MSTASVPPRPRRRTVRCRAYRRERGRCCHCHVVLPPDTLKNLEARLSIRSLRVRAAQKLARRDLFYLGRELGIYAAFLSPRSIRRWRTAVHWWVEHSEWELDQLRKIEGAILRYEPESEQWLRRRLDELKEGATRTAGAGGTR